MPGVEARRALIPQFAEHLRPSGPVMLVYSLATLEAHDPNVLRLYEGLIFSTARRYSIFVEEDLEDIQQILRVKVFRALESYDGAKAPPRTDGRSPRDAYVFQCVRNQAKDLL